MCQLSQNLRQFKVEGTRIVNRTMEYYNLDMVLSVGYRVKSDRGIKYQNRIFKLHYKHNDANCKNGGYDNHERSWFAVVT